MAKLDENIKIVMLKGERGQQGSSIENIEKTTTSGLVDTYTVTLTNGKKYSFNVTNGAKGDKGTDGKDAVVNAITIGEIDKIVGDQ